MLKKLKSDKGFTIIEVLIVLAIAGLILLIVFLAVPALQRNNRNTQRKSDVSALLGGIAEFSANNNGVVPTAACYATGTVTFSTGNCAAPSGTTAAAKLAYYTVAPGLSATAVGTALTDDALEIRTANKCASTAGTTQTSGAGSRSIAVVYATESGGGLTPTCQDS